MALAGLRARGCKPINPVSTAFCQMKRAAPRDRPSVFSIVSVIYAAIFTFSTATATRFEIGWATSPASFSIASVFFDV